MNYDACEHCFRMPEIEIGRSSPNVSKTSYRNEETYRVRYLNIRAL